MNFVYRVSWTDTKGAFHFITTPDLEAAQSVVRTAMAQITDYGLVAINKYPSDSVIPYLGTNLPQPAIH